MPDPRLLVVIPARNEEATLGQVLADIRETLPSADVLVVNDGSSDATSPVAVAGGARVLELPFTSGVGAAMRLAYRVAAGDGYEWTVRVDADGQHPARSALTVLTAAQASRLDLAIGVRASTDRSMPTASSPRRLAMKVLAAQASRASGMLISDATSGLRVTSAACTALYARDYPCEFLADTVEPIAMAARAGLTIGTVPVVMQPRAGGSPSQSTATASFHVARSVLALTIGSQRRPIN